MRKIILVVIIAISFYSCKDSSNNTPITNSLYDYVPTEIGSWWEYEDYEVDEDGNESEEPVKIKSILENVETIGDSTFVNMINYSMDNNENVGEINYKIVGNKLYSANFIDLPIPMDNPPEVLLMDYDKNEWEVLNLDDYEISFFGTEITSSIRGNAQKSYTETIKVKNKNIECQTVDYEIKVTGETVYMGQNVQISTEIESKVWLGIGVGIVKSRVSPVEISIFGINEVLPGTNRYLTDYQIAK